MVDELSLEYKIKLAMVKEEAGGLKVAVFLCNQNLIEEQRRVSRNIGRMEGNMKGDSTTNVTIVDEHGNSTELINKLDIERDVANGNENLGHQIKGDSQLLTPAFVELLGQCGEGPSCEYVLQDMYIFPPD